MAKCNISINFNGSADQITKMAQQAISGEGGSFSGDDAAGKFVIPSPLGKVEGSYLVDNQSFNINISDKPFLLSCNRIEEELRKYIR